MNRIFLVSLQDKFFYFSEDKFWEFCKTAKNHNWFFWYGEVNSNKPLKSAKDIRVEDFKNELDLEKLKPLLKYKKKKFGTVTIYDTPFFNREVYDRYGEVIGWNEKF